MPLATLLSRAFVAYTIEVDNEVERRMPHRTTDEGSAGRTGPWLVSMAMWWNCMRFVTEDGVSLGALTERAGTPTNLHGMQRWGYIVVVPALGERPKRNDAIIRPTPYGRVAQATWRPLLSEIEERWERRFGTEAVRELGASLLALTRAFVALPDCLPILGHGLFSRAHVGPARGPVADADSATLPALLAKALLELAARIRTPVASFACDPCKCAAARR